MGKMNIHVAIQNTIAQFQGVTVNHINKQGTLWNIRISKEDREMEFEIDEIIRTVCVLERKNFGLKSVSRFMSVFIEEIDSLEDEEEDMDIEHDDPINPARD